MNNGRVNIMGPNHSEIFKLYEQVPLNNESTSYKDAMAGNWQSTVLSEAFFSAENIRIIQNAIKAAVYHMSKTMYVIGDQNEDTLKIIMRSIYLQHAANQKTNILNQINALNKLVLDYCIPQLCGECDAYIKYKNDVSTLAVPLQRPVSTYSNNVLETTNFF